MCLFIFNLVAQYDLTLVDRNITPRMPWHDMTVGMVSNTIKILVLMYSYYKCRWDQLLVMLLVTLSNAGTF